MATTTIDTHGLVKQLRGVGFSDEQAETLTGIVKAGHDADRFVTKEFLRAELQLLEQRLNACFESLEQKMDARSAETDRRFESLEQRMTIRLGSMLVVGIGIVAALVRLL